MEKNSTLDSIINSLYKRKRLCVVLKKEQRLPHNELMTALINYIPNTNSLRATQLLLIASNTGKCQIFSGKQHEVLMVYRNLFEAGLNIVIS